MSANDVIDEIIYNVKSNVHNIDRQLGDDLQMNDALRNSDEDIRRLAKQTKALAQQIESLCTALQKREEYNRGE